MNVTCPQCATIFRVDPAKVPERGVRARCSVCAGLIAVRRPPLAPEVVTPRPALGLTEEMPSVRPVPAAPVIQSAPPALPRTPPAPAAVPVPPPAPMVPPPPTAEPARFAPAAVPEPPVMPNSPPSVTFSALPPDAPGPGMARGGAARGGSPFTNPFLQQDPGTRARRLARALISDLVVYHPEKRQRGLADGNLKELFAEEIRKSWEEYSEQVGEEIASSTPYFTEALNEILSEGRQLFG